MHTPYAVSGSLPSPYKHSSRLRAPHLGASATAARFMTLQQNVVNVKRVGALATNRQKHNKGKRNEILDQQSVKSAHRHGDESGAGAARYAANGCHRELGLPNERRPSFIWQPQLSMAPIGGISCCACAGLIAMTMSRLNRLLIQYFIAFPLVVFLSIGSECTNAFHINDILLQCHEAGRSR